MKILHLDSSILGDASVSRELSRAVVERLVEENPGATVVRHDLAADPIDHLTMPHLAARGGAPIDDALREDVALGDRALDELLAADTVVIGVAFYNFSVSTQLKAWIDRVVVAGKTFRYTDHGPEGLIPGKRVILAISRGGYYGAHLPTAGNEHADSYLRALFRFMGVTDIETIEAEGIAMGPERRAEAIEEAKQAIAALPKAA